MPGILDLLQTQQVGQDPTSQGIAALPASTPANDSANFVPPTTDSTGAAGTAASDQSALGGLLGNVSQGQVVSAVSTAAQDPVASKGLLGALAGKLQNIGDSISNLSPAASQGFLATGLGILANNDGSKNLSQLVGIGGINGLNAYNDSKQMQAQQTFQQQQQAIAQAQATEKARNDQINNVVALQNAKINQQNADTKAAALQNVPYVPQVITNPDGTKSTVWVNPKNPTQVGASYTTDTALPADNQKTVNDANTQAVTDAQALTKTQMYLQKLSPTITDPSTGQQVPNPNYVNIQGGVSGTADNFFNTLAGNQSEGQQLKAQIQADIRNTNMASFRGLGSFSDRDAATLAKGLPPDNAGGAALAQYLTAYGNLQQTKALQSQAAATYLNATGGDTRPLRQPLNFNGQTYPAGTTYSQFIGGKNTANSNNIASTASSATPTLQSLLAEKARRQAGQ